MLARGRAHVYLREHVSQPRRDRCAFSRVEVQDACVQCPGSRSGVERQDLEWLMRLPKTRRVGFHTRNPQMRLLVL